MATIAEALALVAQSIEAQAQQTTVAINALAGKVLELQQQVAALDQAAIPQDVIDRFAALSQPVTLPDVAP